MATKTAIDAAGIRPERQAMEKSGSNTKKLIEQAAIKVFMEKGFMGASLRQIVKNAGVTTGAFYKYYPTKEKLFAWCRNMRSIYMVYMTRFWKVLKNCLRPSSRQG